MRKAELLAFVFILTGFFSYSQGTKGIVLDKSTREPIEGVHVTLENYNYSTITNKEGEFDIGLKADFSGQDTVQFSYVGYATVKFALSQLNQIKGTVLLDKASEQLSEVNIRSAKKLKPRIHFEELSALEDKLYSFASILIGDKIYVTGGNKSYKEDGMRKEMETNLAATLDDLIQASRRTFSWKSYNGRLQVYDINSDSWSTSKVKLQKRANHNLNFHDNKLYISGGTTLSKNGKHEYLEEKIEVLDLATDSLFVDDVNPHQASGSVSVVYGDNIIVMGGSVKITRNGNKKFSNKVHQYDLKSGLWYEVAAMPVAKETQGVLIKDKIFLVGGFKNEPLRGIESFDLTTGRWKKEAELPNFYQNPAVTKKDNFIYFFENGKLGFYDTEEGELKVYDINLLVEGAKLHYYKNKLYILGGYKENVYSKKPTAKCYSVDLNEFHITKAKTTTLFDL